MTVRGIAHRVQTVRQRSVVATNVKKWFKNKALAANFLSFRKIYNVYYVKCLVRLIRRTLVRSNSRHSLTLNMA